MIIQANHQGAPGQAILEALKWTGRLLWSSRRRRALMFLELFPLPPAPRTEDTPTCPTRPLETAEERTRAHEGFPDKDER